MNEGTASKVRLVNFVSEEQLDESKKTRGERVEDGTAQRDRPLYEILRENKDKKDAEFNERFKHRPPKALDEDESEFLDNLELSRKEYDRQKADEEAQQLRSFQAAIEARTNIVNELKEDPPVAKIEEHKLEVKKKPVTRPLNVIIKAKPLAKKPKLDPATSEDPSESSIRQNNYTDKSSDILRRPNSGSDNSRDLSKIGLVFYSDESEED